MTLVHDLLGSNLGYNIVKPTITYTLSEGRGCQPRQRRWGSPLHSQKGEVANLASGGGDLFYTLRRARLQTSPAAVGISYTLSEGRGCQPRQRRWGSLLHSQKGEVANLASGGGDLFYTLRRARLPTSPAAVGISFTLSEGRGFKPRQRRWGSPLHRQIANSPVYT